MKTVLVKRSVEKDGLPDIGTNVWAHTVFQSEGKDAEDFVYGFMDESGDLIQITHENGEDNYGWTFEECVDYYYEEVELSELIGEIMPSEEDYKEPIQNALYATGKFTIDGCDTLSDGILQYIKEHFKFKSKLTINP